MPAQEKIKSIREKMSGLEKTSDAYIAYADIVNELEKMVLKGSVPSPIRPVIVVHKAAEPEICESCQ